MRSKVVGGIEMIAVRGIFDGQMVHLLDPPPSAQKTRVIVTFIEDGEEWNLKPSESVRYDPIDALQGATRELKLREKLLEYRAEERARS